MTTTSEAPGAEQAPTKVCRKCSVQTQTAGQFCPNCGASFERRQPRLTGKRLAIIAVVAVALLLVVGGTLKIRHDHAAATAAARVEAREKADAEEAARKQQEAENAKAAQDAADDAERSQRESLIRDMQKSITKDARKSVADDILDGPILFTQCTPLGGGSSDDLTAITGTFSCLAATKKNSDGTISGYSYSATANWDDLSYSWHLGN